MPGPSRFEVSGPGKSSGGALRVMRSGGGVLCIAAAQLLVGLCLLGLYEGYKAYYFNKYIAQLQVEQWNSTSVNMRVGNYENPMDPRSPMGFTFYLAIINNIFSIAGLAGVLNAQRELVIAFFAYNAAQMVFSFHFFVDMVTDTGINYSGEPPMLTAYEKASAAFLFFNFILSVAATVSAMRAVDEIRSKQREEYNRLTVLSDTLAFEADHP
eukprot:GHRQ01006142.1.p1 GENE.GHRQ01006142.1~~GHRQ01006142.1.p1  ORF type:complete len:212 (+),score=82.53 GHRQ01006142.1:173-808(+)